MEADQSDLHSSRWYSRYRRRTECRDAVDGDIVGSPVAERCVTSRGCERRNRDESYPHAYIARGCHEAEPREGTVAGSVLPQPRLQLRALSRPIEGLAHSH